MYQESMDIDYNKLKSFLAVVRCGGVTAAARELNRTQSAVSQAVRGLEESLGMTLIEWEGKRLKLTRAGQWVYDAVNDRMASIEEELASIVSGNNVGGCIEIGVLSDHSTRIHPLLFKTLAKFREKYPAVTFKIRFGTSLEIEQALLDQQLDIGFLINFRERRRFHVFEVAREEHIIATSSKPPESIKEVISQPLIDIDETFTCLTPWVEKHAPSLVKKLGEKRPVIAVADFSAIKELVLSGQGIAVLPRYLIEEEIKEGKAIQVLPQLAPLWVSVDCAIVKGRAERLSEKLLIEFISLDSVNCHLWQNLPI